MKSRLRQYQRAGIVVKGLGWLLLTVSILSMAAAMIPLVLAGRFPNDLATFNHLLLSGAFVGIAVFHFGLGDAIKEHREWGRIGGIIFGSLQLLGFPIGTVIGSYILWCLIKGWGDTSCDGSTGEGAKAKSTEAESPFLTTRANIIKSGSSAGWWCLLLAVSFICLIISIIVMESKILPSYKNKLKSFQEEAKELRK